jgi:phosphate acetyltransferase
MTPETRIRELAATLHFDLTNVQLVSAPHSHAAAEQAVALARAGQITGAILDGPLALDNAINHEAAAAKSIKSVVAGDADILLVPNMEAGNLLVKELTFLANAEAAGIVLGARVPIILTSRADSVRARLASCAIVALYAQASRLTRIAGDETDTSALAWDM